MCTIILSNPRAQAWNCLLLIALNLLFLAAYGRREIDTDCGQNRYGRYISRDPLNSTDMPLWLCFCCGWIAGLRSEDRIFHADLTALCMPSLIILVRNVLGLRPRTFAAPWGPSTRQPVFSKVRMMYSRSTSSRVFAAKGGSSAISSKRSIEYKTLPLAWMTARSIALASSLTLPGHE